eukprot:m.12526 g.12526  ORF g.12526 m.12526 type:complete len:301 (+) comp24112_c0_seq2:12-914(+)
MCMLGGILSIVLLCAALCLVLGLVWGRHLSKKAVRKRLFGRVVLVTGASSGLGKRIARECHNAGCFVIVSSRKEAALLELCKELGLSSSHALPLDVSDFKEVQRQAEKALSLFGRVDILINNAGVSQRCSVLDSSLHVDRRIMDVNYFGAVALTRALLPTMVKEGRGHVVAISSVQGKMPMPHRSSYSASKHAMQAFFTSLRAEVSHLGIQVTVVSPGYINTSLSVNALVGDGSQYKVTDGSTAGGMSPEYVADTILEAIASQRDELVISDLKAKAGIYLQTLAPSFMRMAMAKRYQQEN